VNLSLGAAGGALGVSGGDLRRAGFRHVSEEQLGAWRASPSCMAFKMQGPKGKQRPQRGYKSRNVLFTLWGEQVSRTVSC
jgi:hypothetical protein